MPISGSPVPTLGCSSSMFSTLCVNMQFQNIKGVIVVELRTQAMPVGVGGGKERGGFHLNLRT